MSPIQNSGPMCAFRCYVICLMKFLHTSEVGTSAPCGTGQPDRKAGVRIDYVIRRLDIGESLLH
jgi:hypothetical protein